MFVLAFMAYFINAVIAYLVIFIFYLSAFIIYIVTNPWTWIAFPIITLVVGLVRKYKLLNSYQ